MKPRDQAQSSGNFRPAKNRSLRAFLLLTYEAEDDSSKKTKALSLLSMGTTAGAGLDPLTAAERAVSIIGFGYDVNQDIRLAYCKPGPSGSRLIDIDPNSSRHLVFPGEVVVPNVPNSIKCYKGERIRVSSGVLSFDQMSEQFNQELSLSGKIPSGQFNAMFGMTSCLQKDAAATKKLAYDGWFMTLYNVELDRANIITLSENIKKEVPSSWNPGALAEFIENYGTHVVAGVKMGGMDVIFMKQLSTSNIHPDEVQNLLTQLADERFSMESKETSSVNPPEVSGELDVQKRTHDVPWLENMALAAAVWPHQKSHSANGDLVSISVRRGGIVRIGQNYTQWLSTISQSPNIITMLFVPITSLLHSVPGNGFLRHAINLYLRHKPPREELHQFLQFQLPRQWASVHDRLGFGLRQRRNMSPSLKFTFMGSKLYVNTVQIESGYRPVTGIRLFLEGRNSNYLGVHLQHLSNLPSIFHISDDHDYEPIDELVDRAYLQPVRWKMFSHVCTAPVQYHNSHVDDFAHIVTKAWFEVELVGMKKVLFLRLGFSTVSSAVILRSEWDKPSISSRKAGFFSTLISTRLTRELHPPEKPTSKIINSAVCNGRSFDSTDAPLPTKAPKMKSFVDTKEMARGPDDSPGHWVVTGARLCLEAGKISILAKYSLLRVMPESSTLM